MTARIGSRKSPTIFYLNKGEVFVSCGCFKGTLVEFQSKVKSTYADKDNQHRKEYDKEIKIVKILWKGGK